MACNSPQWGQRKRKEPALLFEGVPSLPRAAMVPDRKADMYYDWRNRLIATKGGVETSESISVNRPMIPYAARNEAFKKGFVLTEE